MLNAPSNLSGLLLSFIPTALPAFLDNSDCLCFGGLLVRISEHLMPVSFALLPQLLFTKLQPTAGICEVVVLVLHQLGANLL
jgi:hypothetical protein